MVEGIVKDDKLPSNQELCWVAAEDFGQFPMATPQKKMIKTYEDSKKGQQATTLFIMLQIYRAYGYGP